MTAKLNPSLTSMFGMPGSLCDGHPSWLRSWRTIPETVAPKADMQHAAKVVISINFEMFPKVVMKKKNCLVRWLKTGCCVLSLPIKQYNIVRWELNGKAFVILRSVETRVYFHESME